MKNTKLVQFLIIGIALLILLQCKDDQNPVPETDVNITIDINSAEFNDLVPGSYKYITGGVSGILLYRKNFSDFSALERTCPYEAAYGTRVSVDPENELYLQCDTCQSRFYIENGMVTQGPSEFPLKSYNTNFDGRYLRIYN